MNQPPRINHSQAEEDFPVRDSKTARRTKWNCWSTAIVFAATAIGFSTFIAPNKHLQAAPPKKAQKRVDFATHIRPLLSKHCFSCHGPDSQEAGLRLDVRRRAQAGGNSGLVIIAGNSKSSPLIERISSSNDDQRMPPDGKRLSPKEIATLRAWIDQGARWPDALAGSEAWQQHWAFQPIRRPAVPETTNHNWNRNVVDRFILHRLETEHISPAPEAHRSTLIRRLSLDLLGLLPSPEDVDAFLNDKRPDAYQRLVERMLASPHYGERWGRHWLDLARYADSGGYEADTPRIVWPYRDWVINAINADMPFDRFVVEQLAGDLLPDATRSQIIASGFHANAQLDPGLRWQAVMDQVNTTGTVFLGLTLGCAQCHSHKTDPVTHNEYYSLYAFFNNASLNTFELASAERIALRDDARRRVDEMKKKLAAYEAELKKSGTGTSSTGVSDQQQKQMAAELERLTAQVPVLLSTLTMRHTPATTHVFQRGDPKQPGKQVKPGVPAFLHKLPAAGVDKATTRTRLDLGRWLVSPKNPLTARVAMNRIWQHHFGRGLVETGNDFGVQTPPPSHPKLLDWLAAELMSGGWNMKEMHRLILCSATYRQLSEHRPRIAARDPRNRLLARQNRFRVEAELIRDIALETGGLLSKKIGGPSVFPYQPGGVLDNRATKATWSESSGLNRYRRGMYTWFWRLTPHPTLVLFDAPDGVTACTRRDRSNTPVQALTLLNDPTFLQCARALADRVLRINAATDQERLRRAFRLCLSREPRRNELLILRRLLDDEIKEAMNTKTPPEARRAAWTIVGRTLLNLDEFITRE